MNNNNVFDLLEADLRQAVEALHLSLIHIYDITTWQVKMIDEKIKVWIMHPQILCGNRVFNHDFSLFS